MKRVALVVTGELERRGLAASLARIFPEASFHVELKVDGFTTARVRNLGATTVPTLVDKMARALVAAVDPGRSGTPSDLAIAVDDLEIANLDQPGVVVETFRDAVVRHADVVWKNASRRELCRERLRDRASFHLLSPMTEAYFFGQEGPMVSLGVAGRTELAPGVDLEEFTVADATYLTAPEGSAEWAKANRRRHPKHYLQYLMSDGYGETDEGLAALEKVDWRRLADDYPAHLRFLRALLADLAHGLGRTDVPPGPEHEATRLRGGVLRNA
jgi:hypothetical protein